MALECQKFIEIGLEKVYISKNSKEAGGLDLHQISSNYNQSGLDQISTDYNPSVVSVEAESLSEFHGKGGSSSNKELLLPAVGLPLSTGQSVYDLPLALISEIFNCLDPKDLGVASCVSTVFYRVVSEHQAWKDFYHEMWGQPISLEPVGLEDRKEKSWKELFVEKAFRSRMYLGRFSSDTLYGHTEAVRAVFVLASKKIIFTSGYDQTVRMWDLEEGLSIATSRPLGSTIRAVAADAKLLIAGGTDGFIHGWKAVEGNPHLFDIRVQNQNMEFRIWEHEGPITCIALDFSRIYSGSWDMTVRIWDRFSLQCMKVLFHSDWVWSLAPHDTTVATASGTDVCVWDTVSGLQIAVINTTHGGSIFCLVRSHTGNLLFTGGEDGAIHMYEISGDTGRAVQKIAKWIPHTGPVYSLAFEFPWLVSSSSDGKLSLIDVRNLLKRSTCFSSDKIFKVIQFDEKNVEPPQRMLHGYGPNIFAVDVGLDRIVCGGEDGVVRIWNFSQALEYEQKIRTLRGLRLENRMRRRKLQTSMSTKNGSNGNCSVAALKNQSVGTKNGSNGKCSVAGLQNLNVGNRNSFNNRRHIQPKIKGIRKSVPV